MYFQAKIDPSTERDFDLYCDQLRREGVQIPSPEICSQRFFDASRNPKPQEAIAKLRRDLSRYPKKRAAQDRQVQQIRQDFADAFGGFADVDAAACAAVFDRAITKTAKPAPSPSPSPLRARTGKFSVADYARIGAVLAGGR